MFIIIGLFVVFGSVLYGYVSHNGDIAVLIQVSEFIIIGGAALGVVIVGNSPSTVGRMAKESVAVMKPNPFTHAAYLELLQTLYAVFQTAKKEGLMGLEKHVESPETSSIFQEYPIFASHHHAVNFLNDNLKVLLTGTVDDFHLAEILDLDLDRHHDDAMKATNSLGKLGDALPAFGIVAAVLGVIITMGSINAGAATVGKNVAAALVGTFLGIFLAYGVVMPMAQATGSRVTAEHNYLSCIRTGLLSFARGDAPMTSVEFARRNIEPAFRPSFDELEAATRSKNA